ncbi:MAG: hypothetical protein PF480_06440, partial [Roseovarius sp.]|nr:hypothetical protein [Roseovarius sp.]
MRDSRISLTVALALWACLTGASFADESTVRKIENMISTTSETRTTKVKLERCKLLVVNASLVNCSERNTPSEQASKVARAVWEIDLTTVDRVR